MIEPLSPSQLIRWRREPRYPEQDAWVFKRGEVEGPPEQIVRIAEVKYDLSTVRCCVEPDRQTIDRIARAMRDRMEQAIFRTIGY